MKKKLKLNQIKVTSFVSGKKVLAGQALDANPSCVHPCSDDAGVCGFQ